MKYKVVNKLNQVHAKPCKEGKHTKEQAFDLCRLVAQYESKIPVFYVTKEDPIYIWKRSIL